MIRALLLALALCLAWPPAARAQAAVDPAPLTFENAAEETRFRSLILELRCVMCQNQSLADSNAQIAHDLRREVLALMRRGQSDAQIREHLVARYGEFVLYRPRVGPATWLLWFGPLVVLGAGGVVIWRIVAARRREPLPPIDDSQEW
ncbi:cytochrome c-type biogenesis protein CcmH [Luteimonas sp. S4-F44]|uniref:cytochrome c-type biogenesis protein n=1 Tax=Luteimonas sp. S4-F44 TaxID=2925842 RepID=UPI001F534CFD|nr:cytochrome c-type biogenesis protein [Luteimonas sp. S4-F44]UNK41463.1 cytochrome c-type biogenesis protein CcmH [Luteimonas sp. S4-F44]